MLIHINNQDLHRVANIDNGINAADVATAQLADVAKPIATGQNLNEGTKFLGTADDTIIDFADLDSRGASLDRP
jgi:hypothetical protein